MSSTFTVLKQQAFGSLMGSMFETLKREHNLTDADLAQIALTLATARAVEAHWSGPTFIARAQSSYDVQKKLIGKVTANAPATLLGPNGKPPLR
jgi:hypothetical protein